MLPIHWATFNLAPHWWSEPIRWTRTAAAAHGVRLIAPLVGARVDLAQNDLDAVVAAHQDPWWEPCSAPEDRD